MKREILILNGVCLALSVAFLVFALYNALMADSFGSFLTIDNLFITAFCLLMALVFFSIPASWVVQASGVRLPFIHSAEAGTESLPAAAGARTPGAAALPGRGNRAALPAGREVQRDAKGRPVPADVQRMLAEMNKSEQKSS